MLSLKRISIKAEGGKSQRKSVTIQRKQRLNRTKWATSLFEVSASCCSLLALFVLSELYLKSENRAYLLRVCYRSLRNFRSASMARKCPDDAFFFEPLKEALKNHFLVDMFCSYTCFVCQLIDTRYYKSLVHFQSSWEVKRALALPGWLRNNAQTPHDFTPFFDGSAAFATQILLRG